MKYWLITTEYPPIHGGGISTYALHTARMLLNKGHQVKVFIHDYNVISTLEKDIEGVGVVYFNHEQICVQQALGHTAAMAFTYATVLQDYICKEGKPDYIETQDYLGIGYYLQQRKQVLDSSFQDIPIVVTMHAPGFLYLAYNQIPQYKLPDFWTGEMEKSSIRSADILISPSQYLIDELKPRMTFEDLQAFVIPNPFLPTYKTSELNFDYTSNDIVFFGKLTPQKGCIEMLQYFKKMWESGFEHRLRVIGGGDHFFYPKQEDMITLFQQQYKKYIKKGLLVFEGKLTPEESIKSLLKAHIVLVPSIVDNLPYVVLEAMSLGKIVLGSNSSGHREVIFDGENGFIFDHQDKNSFAKKLEEILQLNQDAVKRIGLNAALRVEEYCDYDRVYDQKMPILSGYQEPRKKSFSYTNPSKNTQLITTSKENLTVVIPHYNLGAYIKEAVQSVLNSDILLENILIIDDGSTDQESLNVLKSLENNLKIEVLYKKNSGLASTRNEAARLIRTEHFAFLDADDTVEPNYYKHALEVLINYDNVHFVGCWAQYFGESQDVWPAFNPEPPYLLVHNMINSSGLVYKTESFLQSGLNDPRMIYGMEDYDSVISMVSKGFQGIALPQILWNYRIRSNSMAQAFNRNSQLFLYNLIAEKHKSLFSQHATAVVNLLNANGSGIDINNPTKEPRSGIHSLRIFNTKWGRKLKQIPLARTVAKSVYRLISNK